MFGPSIAEDEPPSSSQQSNSKFDNSMFATFTNQDDDTDGRRTMSRDGIDMKMNDGF